MINHTITRRQMLEHSGKGASALFLTGLFAIGSSASTPPVPKYEILGTGFVSDQPNIYYGWPTLAQRGNELLVSVSGGRENHICPFGRVDLFRSRDGGKTWTWPQTIYDGPIDDRDSGILVTAKGTLIVTTFTSLAYRPLFLKEAGLQKQGKGQWDKKRFNQWNAVDSRFSDEEKKQELGCWALRSTDDGRTWSARYSTILNSPHGPIQLKDGRLLYPGKALWNSNDFIGVAESKDDGISWKILSEIPLRKGDSYSQYHELHGVEAANGRIIVQIRNHSVNNNGETLQTESDDGGKNWTIPHTIGVWGLPSFLCKLKDNRLLMTYGHRRDPLGNQARISEDNGTTWSDPVFVSKDGTSGDLGYPSTIQFSDETLYTVWYEKMKTTPRAVLRFAHWKLL